MSQRPDSLVIIQRENGMAQVGTWNSPQLGITSAVSGLTAYAKGGEDIECILRGKSVLQPRAPIEINTLQLQAILTKATVLDEILSQDKPRTVSYVEFAREHPIISSFPAEALWICKPKALKALHTTLVETLPQAGQGLSDESIEIIAKQIVKHAGDHPKTHGFWNAIAKDRHERAPLSSYLLAMAAAGAVRARASAVAGPVPLLDPKARGCVNLAHRYNVALATVLNSQTSTKRPVQFYNIPMNSTAFRGKKGAFIDQVIRNASLALEPRDIFGGIIFSIRGLDRIRKDPARTSQTLDFVRRIGRLGQVYRVPIIWSRAGLDGLAGLDEGVHFATSTPNLSHTEFFSDGGPGGSSAYGRVFNHVTGKMLSVGDVEALRSSADGGMPSVPGVPPLPPRAELYARLYHPRPQPSGTTELSATSGSALDYPQDEYHLWSKPHNIATMTELSRDWQRHVLNGESHPGRTYLARVEGLEAWRV